MAIGITVQFITQAGKGEEFAEGFNAVAATVRSTDKGCQMYDLFRSTNDDTRFVLLERWASQEDLDTHMQAPHMAQLREVMGVLDGQPSMTQYPVE